MRCSMCTSCSRSTLRRGNWHVSRRQSWCSRNGVLSVSCPVSWATLHDLADADPLPPLPTTGWEETTVLAAAMARDPDRFVTDLMPQNLALAGRCAAQPVVSEGLKDKVRRALVERTQDPAADLRARIAAGLALGELGDPRFVRRQGPDGAYLLPPLVDIPGGTYHIGSNEGLYADEAPVHRVELQAFAMAPIPGDECRVGLVHAGRGYEEERWWETEEARAWQRGEGTAEGAKQQWRDDRKRFRTISTAFVNGISKDASRRNRQTTGKPSPA